MVPSYFGWIAAQLVAMGILFQVVAGIPTYVGIWIGTAVVLVYTYVGGLWAISITDFIQTVVIVFGLLFLAFDLGAEAGGISAVIDRTPEGFFRAIPEPTFDGVIHYFAAWITIGLGSIPQQDVFQRVMAARSEKVAVRASFIGAGMYLSIGFIPLFIGLCTIQVYPTLLDTIPDAQLMLPTVVLQHAGIGLQILFFGALLSAIMSTTSGAILAPATILAENIIKPRWKIQDDRVLLRVLQGSVGRRCCGFYDHGIHENQYLRSGCFVIGTQPCFPVGPPDGGPLLEEGHRTGSHSVYHPGHACLVGI